MSATSNIGIKLSLDGASQAEASLRRVGTGMEQLSTSAASVRQALGGLGSALAGALSVREFVQAADAVTQLQNNLRLATGSAQAAGTAYQQLFEIAQRSRGNFAELGNTFASITRATESLGLSQRQVLALTETIGNAITVSGASAQASQAALVQLGQGLASGVLRGEELNSILEQTPRLAKALADGLGVSTGALRKLGQEGKLTAEAVVNALRSQQGVLAAEVQQSVATVGQAFQVLQNSATAFVGTLDAASGSSSTFAQAIVAISQSLDNVGGAFRTFNTQATSTDTLANGIAVAFETVAVLGANVAYVVRGIATEMGGLAAQAAAVARLDFSQAVEIGRLMREDAAKARAEVDALSERILTSRQQAAQIAQRSAFAANDPRRTDAGTPAAGAFAAAGNAATKAKKQVDEFAAALDKVLGKDAGLSSDYDKTLAALFAGYQKGRIGAEAYASAVGKLIEQQPFVKAALDEQVQAAARANDLWDEQFAAAEKARQANEEQIKTAREYLGQLEFETSLLGQNAEQRAVATAVRELEAKGIKDGTQAYAAYIDKIKEAVRLREGKQAEVKAAEDAATAWRKAADQIEQSLTDALMRGFESGKGFAMVLRDTVANMFKTLVLRPIVSAVVNPVAGAITGSLGLAGAANAGQGGNLLGTASNISSAYDTLSNGVSNAVSAGFDKLITNGVGEKLGLSYYNGTGYESTGLGQSVGQYAGMAGNALAGYGLQKAISGGYKTGESGIVDAITVAASAYFGPIAGVAAGVFNRAFGRKLADQGLQGQFGGEAGFTGENYQFLKGGWFRSDKTKTSALDADMQSGLADQFKAIQVQTALMATVLGDTGQSVADFTSSIKLSFNGLTEAQIGEKLAETFTNIADQMALAVLGGSAFAKEGETSSQTLQRLANSLTTVNGTFDVLGFSLQSVSLAGADAASDFLDLIGGLDAFKAATAGYYANFYTEAERQGKATEQLTTQLAALGQTLPTTRDGFRALVEAAEAAGNTTLLAGLLALQDEFAALSQSTDDLAKSAAAAAEAQAAAAEKAAQDAARAADSALAVATAAIDAANAKSKAFFDQFSAAVDDAASAIGSASSNIKQFLDGLSAEAGGVGGYNSAAAAFSSQLTLARGGDRDALGGITNYASTLIDAIRRESGSAAEANTRIGRVRGQLAGLPAQVSAEQLIVDAIERQTLALANNLTGNFQRLDDNLDGLLTFEELKAAGLATDGKIGDVIAALDANGDGQISALEALAGTLAAKFDQLDTSLDGALSFDEFRSAFAGLASDSTLLAIYRELDTNGDGVISRLEAGNVNTAAIVSGISLLGKDLSAQLVSGFGSIDLDLSGAVDYNEFKKTFEGAATDAKLQTIFAEIDTNGDGTITRLEAIKGSTAQTVTGLSALGQQLSSQLVAGFDSIDLNPNGLIDYNEFRNAFAGMATDATLRQIFSELDINGDGTIARLEAIRGSTGETATNTYGLDKLTRISDVVNSLQWGTTEWDAASTRALATVAGQQGWTADDIAKAIGRFTGQEIADFFAKYGSSIAVGGIAGAAASSGTGGTTGTPSTGGGGFVIGGGSSGTTATGGSTGGGIFIGGGYYGALGTQINDPAAVARLDSINGYVNSLDWGNNAAASAWATYQQAMQYGVSQQELAVSTGYNLSDIQALFDNAGVPRFAAGGMFGGGLRLVGENGPELEVTGPSRIYSAADTASLLRSGGASDREVLAELRAMREDNQAQARAIVGLQQRLVKLNERWDAQGLPETRIEA